MLINKLIRTMWTSLATGLALSLILLTRADADVSSPQTVTITGTVVSNTCSFDDVAPTVVLDDIGTSEFTNATVRKLKDVSVNITCGAGVTSVKIVPTGTEDGIDNTLFKNTGTSTGVGLRLQGSDGTIMLPSGSSEVSVTPISGKGNYTFKAGYVATTPNTVTSGQFLSQVTLNFNYN
ncbi:type 1 fimbrial protein [Citrobacter amalonaticus]|uniref:fimbrial protein n=1 Tax=Citrobacter amalonaticus TaxID=35703 RepID=UPI001906050D|nr:fimbrial protein [Citrobacter amalonaticus]MBJ9260676.1 type 1 fimbrial protein [Citrobacter amalonaticus]